MRDPEAQLDVSRCAAHYLQSELFIGLHTKTIRHALAEETHHTHEGASAKFRVNASQQTPLNVVGGGWLRVPSSWRKVVSEKLVYF